MIFFLPLGGQDSSSPQLRASVNCPGCITRWALAVIREGTNDFQKKKLPSRQRNQINTMVACRILRALPAAPLRLAPASRLAIALPATGRTYSSATTTTTTATITHAADTPAAPSAPAATQDAPATKHAGGYFVARSPSNNLPIYEDKKTGPRTLLRKIEGDAHALKLELMRQLQMDDDKVAVNPRTNHIRIKVRLEKRERKRKGPCLPTYLPT